MLKLTFLRYVILLQTSYKKDLINDFQNYFNVSSVCNEHGPHGVKLMVFNGLLCRNFKVNIMSLRSVFLQLIALLCLITIISANI